MNDTQSSIHHSGNCEPASTVREDVLHLDVVVNRILHQFVSVQFLGVVLMSCCVCYANFKSMTEVPTVTCVSLAALLVTKSSSYSISRTLRNISKALQNHKDISAASSNTRLQSKAVELIKMLQGTRNQNQSSFCMCVLHRQHDQAYSVKAPELDVILCTKEAWQK